MLTAAGGLPGELMKNWKVKSPATFDLEFGYSCMGYEIAGAWGAAMADPSRAVYALVGDGSYLMMNSDIYSSVLTGHKIIVVVCDNGGFAIINRLQNFKGGASFNNFIRDSRIAGEPFAVDFAAHAGAMGALRPGGSRASRTSRRRSRGRKDTDRTTVIALETAENEWTPGDAWWDLGVPEVSAREEVRDARAEHAEGRTRQRIGV